MNRRRLLCAAGIAAMVAPCATLAQRTGRPKRIAVLSEGAKPSRAPPEFIDEMRKLGWLEGRDFIFERRFSDRLEQLPALASDLVQQNVDIIMASGTPSALAASAATKTIPILITVDRDPVKSGLVSSLARPGGNVTGLFMGLYEGKMLELLKEAQPKMSLALFAGDAPDPSVMRAKALGVRVEAYPVAGPEDLDGLYAALRKVGADGVFVPMHPWFRANIMQGIAAQFLKMRLPAIAASDGFVEAGGLMAFGPNFDMRRRADQVVRVLKGANPADLAVELPTTFELFVNMTTAKAFGLTIPPSLELRADKLIR